MPQSSRGLTWLGQDGTGTVSNGLGGRRLETIQPDAILPLSLVICQPGKASKRASTFCTSLEQAGDGGY